MRKILPLLALALLFVSPGARAEEGMVPVEALDPQVMDAMKAHGLTLDAKSLKALSLAVVQVGGGGTGSFVSPAGLVVTNHHVAYGCLARLDAMDTHKGILDAGYVAKDRAEELSCPGYYLLILEEVRDITGDVRKASRKKTDWHARFEAERLKKEALVASCQTSGGFVCEAKDFDGGGVVKLMIYTRLRDVRLVYAPEAAIGKFGGDIDNWMYPRHTGDYSFLRAYVAPNGDAVGYAAGNVPHTPQAHLRVSTEGVKKGDLTLVMGYPGSTSRFTSAAGARQYISRMIPWRRKAYGDLVKLLEGLSGVYDDVGRKYAGLIAGLNNACKYYGQLEEGFVKADLVAKKGAAELQRKGALKGRDAEDYTTLTKEMDRIYGELDGYYDRLTLLERMTSLGSASLAFAHTLVRWGVEKQKPDMERKEDRFKDKNKHRLYEGADRLELSADLRAEAAILTYWFKTAMALPQDQRPKAVVQLLENVTAGSGGVAGMIVDGSVDGEWGMEPEALAAWYLLRSSRAASWDKAGTDAAKTRRTQWLDMDGAAIAAIDDPLVAFARALDADLQALKEGPYREVEERLSTELKRTWVRLMGAPYSDANFTLRLTWGLVKDYHETATGRDHRYITDLAGVLAKETGEDPFVVPDKLKAAAKDPGSWRDETIGDVPINFTATLDTTGGNSGSPVLDARGRLVGLLFDGTPESILSDWQYDDTYQRSICVDIRYALFLADKVHDAGHILTELGVK
ncbi:MAG: S46 family peptidase [Pseudomonadota bacterium]